MKKVKIGLALSGGGALGMAHIGVIKALEENGIKADVVVGTSIGALIGGVYASGINVEKMEKEAIKIKTHQLFDFNLNFSGLLRGGTVKKIVSKIIEKEDCLIEDLPITYRAVAVDILKGEEFVFKSGSLLNAIRASIGVPGVFVPYKINDRMFVDGGVLNNLPEDVCKRECDVVISVNLLNDFTPYKTPKTAIDNIVFSFFVLQKKFVETKKNYADVRINPPLKEYRQHLFNKEYAEQMIEIGYNEAIKEMPKIKKAIEKAQKKSLE